MGISINVGSMKNMKQNYSFLFQGMASSGGGSLGNLNFLSDYASIKNGSYGKLMKAYYGKVGGSKEVSSIAENSINKKSTSTAKDSVKTLSEIEKAADNLKNSADALLKTGSKSVFNKVEVENTDKNGVTTTSKEYDTNAIYKSVSSFVNDYNKLIKQAGDAESTNIQHKTNSMIGATKANETLLSKVGITVNSDNTLSLDEKTFKASNMDTVKSLFNGNFSYGYRVSAQASLIDFAAGSEASKANTYNMKGSYNSAYNSGSLYDFGF
jgi:hypothetical protein